MTIHEILHQAGVEFLESGHHHNRSGWLQLRDCPFCGSDNYHLGYNTASHYFACWRCGFHPSGVVFQALRIPRAHTAGLEREAKSANTAKPRGQLVEPKHRGPLLKAHCDYLRSRGLDPEQIVKLWQAEGIGISTRLSWRIYIPITHQGQRVSWTTRSISSQVSQRYVSASAKEEAINHKHLVYGLEYVRGSALIVEGPFDVWNIGPGAVGLFGTAYSTAQIRKLAQIPNRFVCFDNSPTALRRARQLAGALSLMPGRTQIIQLDADDPGSANWHEVGVVRRTCGFECYR